MRIVLIVIVKILVRNTVGLPIRLVISIVIVIRVVRSTIMIKANHS